LTVQPALGLDLYRRMLLIRGIEDRVQSLFLRGEVYGTTHLYSGQEAVAVGFASALRDGDRVACTYRGHGHLLAMGTDPEGLLAELLGRETGVNGGRSGSMNIVDPDHGVPGKCPRPESNQCTRFRKPLARRKKGGNPH
jgi:acetoin:2,6-dichlorophenolindophenol oxidoreductase subunit alpha